MIQLVLQYVESFLPRDARSAKRAIAIVSRPVCNVEVAWAYT